MHQDTNQTHSNFDIPILFPIFNQPRTTRQVFERIREIRPKQLFVAADAPRPDVDTDADRCQQVKDLVLNHIDWDCEVNTLLRDRNLGSKMAISGAITWFFDHVEEGIILEHDCLVDHSFFHYAKTLLEKYRDDERVMMISGYNSQYGTKRGDASYYFSRYPHIWGWATWRRAWNKYDVTLSALPEFKRQNLIQDIFPNPAEQDYWMTRFQNVYDNRIDTWDYPWVFAIFSNNGMCIMPNVNLVSNIGFGTDAMHTRNVMSPDANRPTTDIGEIKHPQFMVFNKDADLFEAQHVFRISPLILVKPPDSVYRKVMRRIPKHWKNAVKRVIRNLKR